MLEQVFVYDVEKYPILFVYLENVPQTVEYNSKLNMNKCYKHFELHFENDLLK